MYNIYFMNKLKDFDIDRYELLDMAMYINNETEELDEFNYQLNEDAFFDEYLYMVPSEIVRQVSIGDYDYYDKYVKVDENGNIKSSNIEDLAILANDMKDEILEKYLNYVENYGVDDFNLEENLEYYTNDKEFIEELKERYFK